MSQPLRIGVLLCTQGVQLLDLAAVDLLGMLSSTFLRKCGFPENVIAKGHQIQFHYIADVVKAEAPSMDEIVVTADVGVRITDTLDSVHELDILVIPGPPPSYIPSAQTIAFIQKHAKTTKAMLVICTGILAAAPSGILSHKRATAPLALIPDLREKMPEVEWVAKRWEWTDAVGYKGEGEGEGEKKELKRKIWTSGAITNGTDMVAAYLRDSEDYFDPELVKLVCALADVGDRAQEYPEWQLEYKFLSEIKVSPAKFHGSGKTS